MNQDVLKNWDEFINWKKRLHYEVPFFREIFENNGTRKILDACCGSGRHAIEFARMGIEVVGLDSSEGILEKARENTKRAGFNIPFYRDDILDLSRFSTDEFDGIVCVGNSLALVESLKNVEKVIKNFTRILKKCGVIVIHLVDLNKLEKTQQFMLPVISGKEDGHERILCRVFHVSESSSSYVTFVLIEKRDGKWQGNSHRQKLIRITPESIKNIFDELLYEKVEIFSSFKKDPIEDPKFTGMIVVARK